jgi:opacity protein-like surface antigen
MIMNGRNPGLLAAVCAVSFVVCCSTAPLASAMPPGAHIGVHFGYVKAADAEDGNGQVGGHLEIPLLPFLGLNGSVDYRLVESFSVHTGNASGDLELKSVPVTATVRLYLPSISTMTLFAGAGAGWYYLIYDYADNLEQAGFVDDNSSTFGWHVAAGAIFSIAPKFSLYGEGRLIYIDPDQQIDQQVIDTVEGFDYDSFYIAGGVNLHF